MLEKKRSKLRGTSRQPSNRAASAPRTQSAARSVSRTDQQRLRPPSTATTPRPLPDQNLFQTPAPSQPQEQPARPPSRLQRPPSRLQQIMSTVRRPASRAPVEQASRTSVRQASRTPVKQTSRSPAVPRAPQVPRQTPARGLQRRPRGEAGGTPLAPETPAQDPEGKRIQTYLLYNLLIFFPISEARIRKAELKRPKLVDRNYIPIECITPDGRKVENIPDNLILNDLLGLGCVLLKNPYLQISVDGTISNGLVSAIGRVAEYWSTYEISEARAFQVLAKLLENIPCFPYQLYNLLCVVIKDYFFPDKSYVHRAYEIQARAEKIKNVYKNLIGVRKY